MKVAINRCYGGFSPSAKLFEALIAKGWRTTEFTEEGGTEDATAQIIVSQKSFIGGFPPYYFAGDRDSAELRTNPDLIEAIEALGKDASGPCGNLCVVEIPDGVEFSIEEYDGFEHIAEVHRTWG